VDAGVDVPGAEVTDVRADVPGATGAGLTVAPGVDVPPAPGADRADLTDAPGVDAPGADAGGVAGADGRGGGSIGRWASLVLPAMIALAPFVAAVVASLVGVGGDYRPLADVALTELATRDIGHHAVTLGPFSRDGWYHPGPALFYVLAVPYRLLGGSSGALPASAAVVAAGSVAGMAAIARRRGGTALMLCVLIALLVYVRAGYSEDFVTLAWNPFITVLPYGLFIMLTWAMVAGDRWALPVGALVATFLVQTHIGYAALALPLLAVGIIGLVATTVADARRARSATSPPDGTSARDGSVPHEGDGSVPDEPGGAPAGGSGPPTRRDRLWPWRGPIGRLVGAGLLTVVAVAVTWYPPVAQQLTHEPGNLGVILQWFRERGDETHTLAEGWRVVSAAFGVAPEWVAGKGAVTIVQEPEAMYEQVLPVLLVPFVLAIVAGWRHPGRDARRLAAVLVAAGLFGVVAVSRTVGLVYAYRLVWTWVLGALAAAFAVWTAWTWLARRFPSAERRVLVPGAVVVLAAVSSVDVTIALRDSPPDPRDSAVMSELVPEVTSALPPGDGPVVVQPMSYTAIGWSSGLVVGLEHEGVDARLPADSEAMGPHRTAPASGPRTGLDVVTDADILTALSRPGVELVAYAGDIDRDELAAAVGRQEDLEEQYAAGEIDAEELLARAEDPLPPGSAVAVLVERP